MEMGTALWLHNKFANDDSKWSSVGIASQFSKTVLNNVYDCFLQLPVKSKIKILLSFLKIPLRNMENLEDIIDDIVNLGDCDPDDWVKVAANIVKDYPKHKCIDKSLGKVVTTFQETVQEVVNEVGRVKQSTTLFPFECLYLNRTVVSQMVMNQPTLAKHFTLRRKPKSAALRAKITQKASDAANQRRSSQSSAGQAVTGKANLKRTNSLSSGRIQHVTHSKSGLSKSSALPKKTKLLDIADQPLGVREQKKRKKVLAMEASLEEVKQRKLAAEQHKQLEEDRPTDTADTASDTDRENEETDNEEKATPQYKSEEQDNMLNQKDAKSPVAESQTTPSYAMLPGSTTTLLPVNLPAINSPNMISPSPNSNTQHNPNNVTLGSTRLGMPTVNPIAGHSISDLVTVDPNATYTTQTLQRELQMRVQHEHEMRMHQHRFNQHMFQQQQQYGSGMSMGGMGLSHQLPSMQPTQPQSISLRTPSIPLQTPRIPLQPPSMPLQPGSVASQQKKGLSLTRDQMLAAQEMFRSANRVTRAEKALILGFMAGARENPFPQQGSVITIKLSQDNEIIEGAQRMVVEMLFEMNYETGHWRRLKRTRVVSQQGT